MGAENTTVDRVPGHSVFFHYRDLCSVISTVFVLPHDESKLIKQMRKDGI